MFKHVFTAIIILAQGFAFSQNLVPNSGFEQVNTCNVNSTQESIAAIDEWFCHLSQFFSPDFFHDCFSSSDFTPPITASGNSSPFSGDGMAGIAMYPGFADYRETLSISLSEPLEKDSAYCVSFWFKNSINSGLDYHTDMINFVFSVDTLTAVDVKNQWIELYENESDSIVENWYKFDSYHIAKGWENFFSIGFVGELDYYHSEPYPNDILYYFIDDVEVKQCNKDSLLNVSIVLPNVFTPGSDGDNDLYEIGLSNISSLNVSILNRWGNEVLNYDALNYVWDGKNSSGEFVSEGVYYIVAIGESKFGDPLKEVGTVHVEY